MPGVVFDLDGVLLDSEALHYRAYNTVLARYGVSVGRQEYAEHWICAGHGPEYAVERYRLPLSPAELRAAKAPLYRELLLREARLMPGARKALEGLAAVAKLGLATNSAREDVDYIVERFELRPFFSALVAREDYPRAKPAPDAYRVALERLGLAPAEVLVVEDSPRGVRAARANGLAVVAIPNEFTRLCSFPPNVAFLAHLDQLTADRFEEWLRPLRAQPHASKSGAV